MKLFVQARKDGYNVLYPKPTPTEFFEFAGDIRPNGSSENLLGKYIYTIAFATGGCIFTKHVVVKDTLRSALGNIGFSIFIPNIKKLSGDNVIKLLDELLKTYCEKYCPDYFLENKTEDWAFFEEIKNQYKPYDLSNDDTENYQHGNADAAFVYYIDKTELCKFFDNPYQEEYSSCKQVFFVEKYLEGKSENPLNAIPHDPNANLTGKIDLENPKYKLIYNQQAKGGVKIEVKVNGSFRYNRSKIKRKEDLEIIWSKQFYEPKVKTVKWYEIGSEFLDINEIEKTISIKEIELQPITHSFTFVTKDLNSNPITGAEISLKVTNNLPERKAINNSIQITAEELQNKCYIIAKKENQISSQREIRIEDSNGIIELILQEHKTIEFNVQSENGGKIDYKINIRDKSENVIIIENKRIKFIGKAIDEDWDIEISSSNYQTKTLDKIYPRSQNEPISVALKSTNYQVEKGHQKKYYIKIDESKGKRSFNGTSIDAYEHKFPQFNCDAKFGYKFERWESFENKCYEHYDGYYEAIFKKLWYRKVPKSALVFFIIAIVASTVFYIIKSDPTKGDTDIAKTEISDKINSYVDGIDLNRDTLNEYKGKHCDSSTFIPSDIKEKSWWQKLWPFGSDEESKTINESTGIPEYFSKIDNAIAIRNAIDLGKIDTLKTMKFSENQKNFKNAIDSIVDKYKDKIGATLKADTVSRMNLNQVAALILKTQEVLRKKEPVTKSPEQLKKEKEEAERVKAEQEEEKKAEAKRKAEAEKRKREGLGTQTLDTEFWVLVNSGNAKMDSYSKLLKKHNNKGGDIIAYLNKICKNSPSFKKFIDIPEMDRKSAKTLTEIDIN